MSADQQRQERVVRLLNLVAYAFSNSAYSDIPGHERFAIGPGDEVVVCYTPGGSPYRIPQTLRDEGPIPPANQAWAARAQTVRDVSRVAGGLPNTCSPIGTGGQTGCALIQSPDYAAGRREQRLDRREGGGAHRRDGSRQGRGQVMCPAMRSRARGASSGSQSTS